MFGNYAGISHHLNTHVDGGKTQNKEGWRERIILLLLIIIRNFLINIMIFRLLNVLY